MRYTKASVIERYNAGAKIGFTAFWGSKSDPKVVTDACLSQWYDCWFEVDGVRYHTTEQYMMAQKAHLMRDDLTLGKIMAAKDPRDCKALGRKVQNFDEAVWDRERYGVVLRGNLAKFSQNPELFAFLDGTGDDVLVEASPYDLIWGVGLRRDDPRIKDPNEWRGENLLGFALTQARDMLRQRCLDKARCPSRHGRKPS